jgi:hypothetical protein
MSDTEIRTLPGKLAAEIARVSAMREQYLEAAKLCGQQAMAPAIFMMTHSLDAAIKAAGSLDITGQITAVRDLEGFSS